MYLQFFKEENLVKSNKQKKQTPVLKIVLEAGFIIFLFYSNLLMGEFTHSNDLQGKSLIFAVEDIFSVTNFTIAVISALIGYVIIEYFRKKL
jgi:hypothetical protein